MPSRACMNIAFCFLTDVRHNLRDAGLSLSAQRSIVFRLYNIRPCLPSHFLHIGGRILLHSHQSLKRRQQQSLLPVPIHFVRPVHIELKMIHLPHQNISQRIPRHIIFTEKPAVIMIVGKLLKKPYRGYDSLPKLLPKLLTFPRLHRQLQQKLP